MKSPHGPTTWLLQALHFHPPLTLTDSSIQYSWIITIFCLSFLFLNSQSSYTTDSTKYFKLFLIKLHNVNNRTEHGLFTNTDTERLTYLYMLGRDQWQKKHILVGLKMDNYTPTYFFKSSTKHTHITENTGKNEKIFNWIVKGTN